MVQMVDVIWFSPMKTTSDEPKNGGERTKPDLCNDHRERESPNDDNLEFASSPNRG